MKKRNENRPQMDERQQSINTKAVAAGGIFAIVCLAISMIAKVIRTEELGWEFWVLLGVSLVIVVAKRVFGDVEQPKSLFGKPLPTGSSKVDKRVRRKDYALGSLLYAGVCTVMLILLAVFGVETTDVESVLALLPGLSYPAAVALAAIVCFGFSFLISYAAEYAIGEWYKVRQYNKMLQQLDEE